ncbi:MAG: hypothetical protein M1834_007687 [Cirrosporium novae-zelandiae]|nr:MAG: hypothetical protein M1834_007687 [Cirrosporium novae-zelandiae]
MLSIKRYIFVSAITVFIFLVLYKFPSLQNVSYSKTNPVEHPQHTEPAEQLEDPQPEFPSPLPLSSLSLPPVPIVSSSIASPSIPSQSSSVFRWKDLSQHYPVTSFIPLPSGNPVDIPKIQHGEWRETRWTQGKRIGRAELIKQAFIHAWNGYKINAWMKDEVGPVSGAPRNTFGGWAATLVDTLDTLWIMGLKYDFEQAVDAVKDIDFTKSEEEIINVFETNIRYLGGFLSAYDLSEGKYPVLLDKAVEVGDMLYAAFDTPNRMPKTRWKWKTAASGGLQEADSAVLLAELGSLTLEFTRLSQLTRNPKYFDAVQRITNHFDEQQEITKLPGMWPVVVDAKVPSFQEDTSFSLSAMADSLYEYLPKEYMLLGGLSPQYRKMYEHAIETAKKHLFFRPMTPNNDDILISGIVRSSPERSKLELLPEGQHLACYVGGMVGIGAKIFDRPDDLDIAFKLADGCTWAYRNTKSGIMPEVFAMVPCENATDCPWDEMAWKAAVLKKNPDNSDRKVTNSTEAVALSEKKITDLRLQPGFSAIKDRRFLLRPEAIESLFILYRITGASHLPDIAWDMFGSIDKHTRTFIGHASLNDVTSTDEELPKSDRMESFWTAETLKYFYLMFTEPWVVDLDQWVFNTEAHPLKRPTVPSQDVNEGAEMKNI